MHMQVTINGSPAGNLPANWQKDILRGSSGRAVTGSVLEPTVAAGRFLSRYRLIGLGFVGLFWAGLFALVAFARPLDREVLVPVAAVLAVATPAMIAIAYRIRSARLRDSLPRRVVHLPPPGTLIRVDDAGLAIGDRVVAWADIAVDRVDFEVMVGRHGDRTYLVHQVDVRAGDFACTLDGLLLEEGQAIVAETCRRMAVGIDDSARPVV
ncbi:MAG TPA: hypothetical protein VMI56_20975 [Reyranella sp.]|nr:hypothetical protein [Reyranella sp.]